MPVLKKTVLLPRYLPLVPLSILRGLFLLSPLRREVAREFTWTSMMIKMVLHGSFHLANGRGRILCSTARWMEDFLSSMKAAPVGLLWISPFIEVTIFDAAENGRVAWVLHRGCPFGSSQLTTGRKKYLWAPGKKPTLSENHTLLHLVPPWMWSREDERWGSISDSLHAEIQPHCKGI